MKLKIYTLSLSLVCSLWMTACGPAPTTPDAAPSSQPSAAPDSFYPVNSDATSFYSTQPVDEELRKEHELTKDNFFKDYGENPFVNPKFDKLSTFAMDVDTASYTWMRKSIQNNLLPDKDSVRIEEYVNFFDYQYSQPEQEKFSINTVVAPSPFGDKETLLMRVGLQGKSIESKDRKDANLTFVIDVSGSMSSDNRLGLVKQSLELLVEQLRTTDKVAIVVYGSQARKVLDYTSDKTAIIQAINSLGIEGATNAEAGLKLGYQLASQAFSPNSINRVILCSDGVANVGSTGPDEILKTIKQNSELGITLTTVGFGMGNYNDVLMEQLANNGDGNFAYVDTLKEAQRIFVENLSGTLQVIAKDAKIQVEFNPEFVNQYRLLGYENREVADKDFRNDSVDGGEVGANHSVTALYEIKLKTGVSAGEFASVNIRYKDVDDLDRVKEQISSVNIEDVKSSVLESDPSFQLAAAVAEYAEILRKSIYADTSMKKVLELAQSASAKYEQDERVIEFISLVQKAMRLP